MEGHGGGEAQEVADPKKVWEIVFFIFLRPVSLFLSINLTNIAY
jgi:hypothetical protein